MSMSRLFSLIGLTALLSAAGVLYTVVMGHHDMRHLVMGVLTGVLVALVAAPVLALAKG